MQIYRVIIYGTVDLNYRQTVERTQMDVSFSSLVLRVNSSMANMLYLVRRSMCLY